MSTVAVNSVIVPYMEPLLDTDMLPPELLLDTTHPSNDQYVKDSQSIRRLITSISAKLPAKTIQICKLVHQGTPNQEIARRLSLTPTTISKHKNAPDSKKLLAAMSYYASHTAGPHLGLRINMLWRIAQKNEIPNPRVAISALSEINKVEIAFKQMTSDTTNGNGNQPLVVINQTALPRTTLDEAKT